jgi:hypothetical protein
MRSIISEINAYVAKKLTLYSTPIYIDSFPSDKGNAIISRQEPSQVVETRYMDGSRAGQQNFAYYARHINAKTADDQLSAIIELLDLPEIVLSDVLTVKIEPVSSPTLTQKSEAGEYIYTASFRLNYYVGGK